MRELIIKEIESMKLQQRQYAELYQQATGAISSLEWVLSQLPVEEMTEKELLEAING